MIGKVNLTIYLLILIIIYIHLFIIMNKVVIENIKGIGYEKIYENDEIVYEDYDNVFVL